MLILKSAFAPTCSKSLRRYGLLHYFQTERCNSTMISFYLAHHHTKRTVQRHYYSLNSALINNRNYCFVQRSYTSGNKRNDDRLHKATEPDSTSKRKQLQTFDDQSSINRMLLDKYRVPEPTTTAEKVKEGAKDIYYFSVFAVALVAAGAMFYYIFKELFSSKSPNSVYSRALKLVVANEQVQLALGTPMKGFGEETRRGRRRHVAHTEYKRDGKTFMRMRFYVKGPNASGSVNLEVKENESGKYDYRYLFVDLNAIPPRSIILIDNR